MEIRLENVSKSYDRPVLKGLQYHFESGKLYVIKGVSGCGKSTLLNILGGVEKEYEGRVVYDPPRPRSAYIFQRSLLLSTLTVRENLQLIRGNAREVVAQAETLGIDKLMDSLPGTISGGERQRAAIERALLRVPQLLLADEPTASLDDENSRKIAEMIAALKREDRILIVATHEDYFDGYADEIIKLDYGVMKGVDGESPSPGFAPLSHPLPRPGEGRVLPSGEGGHKEIVGSTKPAVVGGLSYVLKRQPGLLKPLKLMLTAIFFLMILLGSALQKNVTSEAVRLYKKDKPVDLIKLSGNVVDGLDEETKSQLTVYDCYYAEDNDVTAYYLLPKEYSILGVPGAIAYGRFPEKETEVLVNSALAAVLSNNREDPTQCLNQAFSFCGLELTVSGVVSDAGFRGDFRRDWYYAFGKDHKPLRVEDPFLFLSYSLLQTVGTKKESYLNIIMASCPGIWENDTLQDRLRANEDDSLNDYLQTIRQLRAQTEFYVRTAFIVLLALFAIACLYTVSVIRLELFYRRQELGYLQIFGLSKGHIRRLILLEYAVKLLASLLLAALVYALLAGIYALVFHGPFLLPDMAQAAGMIALLAFMYLITVWLTGAVFLRRSIIQLIT
ncbi:MAG: ATP-binding cassette domain-containing protein [Lachnospiraceae bacterium]|nr:ATP-binding cassette domain-containing protein [Lachnospiraceae bacterium]